MSDYVPKTDEEIKQLAVDTFSGKIFWNSMIQEDDLLPSVFMTIAFADRAYIERLQAMSAVIYEYIDKAGPRSVNGYPIFMSHQVVTFDEYKRIVEKAKAIKEAVDKV